MNDWTEDFDAFIEKLIATGFASEHKNQAEPHLAEEEIDNEEN